MAEPKIMSMDFIRKHYAKGPTAYREDGSAVRMPTAEDVAFCERQFDLSLAAHDREVAAKALREAAAEAEASEWRGGEETGRYELRYPRDGASIGHALRARADRIERGAIDDPR